MSTKGTILSCISESGNEIYAYEETNERNADILGNFEGYNVYLRLDPEIVEISIIDGYINVKILEDLTNDWNNNALPDKFKLPVSGIISIDYESEGFEIVIKGGSITAKSFYYIMAGSIPKNAEERLIHSMLWGRL